MLRIAENIMKMKLKGRCTRRRPDQSGNNRLGIVLQGMNIMWRGSRRLLGKLGPDRGNITQASLQNHILQKRLL